MSDTKTVPEMVGEFLNTCGSQDQVNCPLSLCLDVPFGKQRWDDILRTEKYRFKEINFEIQRGKNEIAPYGMKLKSYVQRVWDPRIYRAMAVLTTQGPVNFRAECLN